MMAAGLEVAPASSCWNLDIRTLCCRYPPLCNYVRESPQITTMFQPLDNVPSDKQAYDVTGHHARVLGCTSYWGLFSKISKLLSRRNMNIQAVDPPHFRLPAISRRFGVR